MKWAILLLFTSLTAFGQSTTIGNIKFKTLMQEDKPATTLQGQVQVFENNILNTGKKIKLNVEVVPAKTNEKKEDPMFIIMGGPGQAATDLVSFFSEIFEQINQKSDLVFVDQRGTGKSNPLQLIASYKSFQDYFKDDFVSTATIRQSHIKLSKDNNLQYYGTLNAIADIETVRKELGYHKINLYGTSYGTRVSLAYINKYPDKVRTATLKGLVPNSLVIPLSVAEDAQRSMGLLINDCQLDSACSIAFPDLNNQMNVFFASHFPIKASLLNSISKSIDTVEISREIIALSLRVLLMAPSSTKNIPYLITQANKGNYEPLANAILSIKKSYIKGVYDGMTLCVICNEDYPYLPKNTSRKGKETFLQDYWIYRVKNACSIWNTKKLKSEKIVLNKQQTRVLLISGNRDAATPPRYGEEVLTYFPNGKHIVVNQGSHSFDGMRNCIENIICDFVITGNANQLDTNCVNVIKFPDYKLK